MNIKYTNGSHSTHSFDDEKETNEPSVNKKVIGKSTLHELDTPTENLNSCSKVILFTWSGFKELDIPNYFSLSQFQGGMDEGKKKGKRNVCHVTAIVSRRKTRRGELVVGPLKPKKSRTAKK